MTKGNAMAMKATFKLIKGKDFIKARSTGEPDLEESKRILVELAEVAAPPADYELLIDCRAAHGSLTFLDIYELVEELGRHRASFRNKIAFLARNDDQFDKARFLQLCARNRGFQVGAFTDFEESIEWLGECEDVHAGGRKEQS